MTPTTPQKPKITKSLRKSIAPSRMTLSAFLNRTDEIFFGEWISGKVIRLAASEKHQERSGYLYSLLRIFVEEHRLGKVYSAPFPIRLSSSIAREPDLLFVSTERLNNLHTNYLDGAPDIAVEFISPESRTRDRRDKFYEYAVAGVREYWIVDMERKRAEFYLLDSEGLFNPMPLKANSRFESEVLSGFWLEVEWLWNDTPPRITEVLALWGAKSA